MFDGAPSLARNRVEGCNIKHFTRYLELNTTIIAHIITDQKLHEQYRQICDLHVRWNWDWGTGKGNLGRKLGSRLCPRHSGHLPAGKGTGDRDDLILI